MLEVVNDALAVEEVHGHPEEVPVQGLCESQTSRPARHVYDADNLFEGHDLDGGYDDDDVDVPGEQGAQKHADHDKGPYCAGDECLLLLLEFRRFAGW